MVVDTYGDRKVHKVVFVAEINQVSDLIVRVCCASGNVLNTGRCKNWNGKFNSNFSTADGWSSNVTTFPMIAKVPPNNFLWQRWSWERTFLRNIGVQDDVDGFSCKSLPAVLTSIHQSSLHNGISPQSKVQSLKLINVCAELSNIGFQNILSVVFAFYGSA